MDDDDEYLDSALPELDLASDEVLVCPNACRQLVDGVLQELYESEQAADDGVEALEELRRSLTRAKAGLGPLYVHVEARMPAYRRAREALQLADDAWWARCATCAHHVETSEAAVHPELDTCRVLAPIQMSYPAPCASHRYRN